jgi:hypothetical protein
VATRSGDEKFGIVRRQRVVDVVLREPDAVHPDPLGVHRERDGAFGPFILGAAGRHPTEFQE